MPSSDEPTRDRSDPGQPVHEAKTVIQASGSDGGEADASEQAAPEAAGVTDLSEFSRALIEIRLIDSADLDAFAADSAEGVLGLSRALVKTGKVTPYQAAAVYQKKSRGLLIGNYVILDKLGQGGMGVVFKARHRMLGRVGALKILPPSFARDRDAVLRFRREGVAAGRLKHPNLVSAQDADEDRGVHFLVMDYVEGRDLERVVRERGPMQVAQAVDCLIQAARGLEAAHAQGIIHRDIKPGNLMLDAAGTVRVLDLGLARIVDAGNPFSKTAAGRLTQSGMYMGTIDYMAPEQAEDSHRVDHRADIYSLGCTLFYLLTAKEPFPGETVLKRLIAHMERPAPPLHSARPGIPPAVEAAYQKMMAKRAEDRPASMAEVITLLEASKAQTLVAPKSQPELKVFNEPVKKRAGEPNTKADPSIFAVGERSEGTIIEHELNLVDLVMDVRPETRPVPLPPAQRLASTRPLERSATTRSRGRRTTSGAVFVALGALALAGAALIGYALIPGRKPTAVGRSPEVVSSSGRDLEGTSSTVKLSAAETPEPRARTIFDGTSARGWMLADHTPLLSSHIQPDGLNPRSRGSRLVVYDQPLGDFVLDFDYKLTKGCSSGVFLRVSDLTNFANTGIEVALDDTTGASLHDSGAFYDLVAPRARAQRPTGQWNHMTITAFGPRLSVVLNDTAVSEIDLDEWKVAGKRPDGMDHQFKGVAFAMLARSGYLAFQNQERDCWFKNIVLMTPVGSATPSPGARIVAADVSAKRATATASSAPVAKSAAGKSENSKPAIPPPAPPRPQWVVLGNGNRYHARNIPHDAYDKLGELAEQRRVIKWISFCPGGGWVILYDKNGYAAQNLPDGVLETLADLAKRGEELKSIAFGPLGAWTVLFSRAGNWSRNAPPEAIKALTDLGKRGVELKSVSYTSSNGCAIIFGRNGYFTHRVPEAAVLRLKGLAAAGTEIRSISFGPNGSWLVLHGPTGFSANNIEEEPPDVVRDMAKAGTLLALSFPVHPLVRLSGDDTQTRKIVLALLAQNRVPGLSVAVVNKGEIEWARGYGVTQAEGSQPVRAETRFQAAALSTTVTAAAALRLVQQGKLELDVPFRGKLLSWKMGDNQFTAKRKPTLRQLLSHTAGFSVQGFAGYQAGARVPTLIEMLDGKAPANSPAVSVEFVPGSSLKYSAGGYLVLQQLIIDVTGKSFASAMRELVFDPVAMKHSRFQQPPEPGIAGFAADWPRQR